ncbi:Cytochrome c family protein [hydrothermal vent metagenome]|uniref:Cytochrome c family protein n=1 Tax=hydrothermal vent metagenome TaxID=652676 RepID=A0A3B1CUG2_9ZZZZ
MKGSFVLMRKIRLFLGQYKVLGMLLPLFLLILVVGAFGLFTFSDDLSWAQPTSEPFNEDVSSTKHNLSAIPLDAEQQQIFNELFSPDQERNIKSSLANGTTEVCVFCHTPHGASREGVKIRAPIWNRNLSKAKYQMYDQVWSKSFEATPNDPGRPTGYSRLCLSCHDGTIALGRVLNKSGSGGFEGEYTMEYPTNQRPAGPFGSIPVGEGATSQNTRALGRDLRNDHPISMKFDAALLAKDVEFVNPGPPVRRPFTESTPTSLSPLRRASGNNVNVYDSVQCTSCHNPHQVDFPKFLRANRLQSLTFASTQAEKRVGAPSRGGAPSPEGAILCLFCHDKPGWPYNSRELNSHFGDRQAGVFDDTRLKPGATNLHDGEAPVVAERACLVCHDPHTRQGAVRILREGVDAVGNVAIENTCYQCHQPQESSILQNPTRAPDIRSQFFRDREGNGNNGTSPTGSAMDLTLGLGHQPVFVDDPKEGVQLGSDNLVPSFFGGPFQTPANNKDTDLEFATNTPDTSHIECVDCHNMHRVTRRNRFKGIPGVTIRSQMVAETVRGAAEVREPWLYEVCLRCHGNTFNNHVREALFTALGTGKMVQARGNSPITPGLGVNAHGSNKRKEFDPDAQPFYPQNFKIADTNNPAGPLVSDPNPPMINTSFHPIAVEGRNQSGVLNNFNLFVDVPSQQGQLMGGFGSLASFDSMGRVSGQDGSGGLSRRATLQCPDCHNTDLFGTFGGNIPLFRGLANGFPLGINFPDYPGPISFDETRGPAYKRITDRSPSIPENPIGIRTSSLNDPKTAQGPHGSIYKRILRANYDTTIGTATTPPPGTVTGQYNPQNFALCFNCHNESAFITPYWESATTIGPKSRLTNFYRGGTTNVDGLGTQGGNLHMLHLIGRTNARCHECHNNVHSNVESGNTIFVGMNDPKFKADNPGHEMSTHLINFQPNITGNRVPDQPMWGAGNIVNGPDGGQSGTSSNNDYDNPNKVGDHKGPGCNLRCHGFAMNHNTDAHTVLNGEK